MPPNVRRYCNCSSQLSRSSRAACSPAFERLAEDISRSLTRPPAALLSSALLRSHQYVLEPGPVALLSGFSQWVYPRGLTSGLHLSNVGVLGNASLAHNVAHGFHQISRGARAKKEQRT